MTPAGTGVLTVLGILGGVLGISLAMAVTNDTKPNTGVVVAFGLVVLALAVVGVAG